MKLQGRYYLIGFFLLFVTFILAWRVITLHIFEQNFLRYQGEARTIRVVSKAPYRGMIIDRFGEPLAISTPVQSVWLNPKEFDLEHANLLALAASLDMTVDQLRDKSLRNRTREFVYLQRHIEPKLADAIKKLLIPGIHLKSEYRRYYPKGEVFAHVLGFTDVDDQGKEGLELAYDDYLSGSAGSKRVIKDRLGREVQTLEGLQDMRSGEDVVLSLDQRLQYLAYRELKAQVLAHKAQAGSAVVLDVKTGEILAMVNQPSFNPNMRVKLKADDGRYRNRAVTDVFEPGSVLKTFSVVNALQNGHVTPATLIDTSPGFMSIGHHVVKEDKNKNFGIINVATILQKSSNIGVSKLTLSLPPERLWETYRKLGFGVASESGFPGESSGVLVQPPKKASFVLATMAFGYGMSVTPIQLAQAYAVLGAGGLKRPVTFLKQNALPKGEQVIDPEVARQTLKMLASVVEQGSGARAKVVGYRIAGKTGTARKVSANGGYLENNHIAVFAGLAPVSNPRFAIVVMIDDPKGAEYYGSQIAAPVFSRIAAGALRLFNIPPDLGETRDLRVASAHEKESVCHNE